MVVFLSLFHFFGGMNLFWSLIFEVVLLSFNRVQKDAS